MCPLKVQVFISLKIVGRAILPAPVPPSLCQRVTVAIFFAVPYLGAAILVCCLEGFFQGVVRAYDLADLIQARVGVDDLIPLHAVLIDLVKTKPEEHCPSRPGQAPLFPLMRLYRCCKT